MHVLSGKITIFGPGNVGGAVARRLVERKLCKKVVLAGRTPGKAAGVALDIQEAGPIDLLEPVCVAADNDPALMRDSDVVIVTAGSPRKKGMSRDELLKVNAEVVRQCIRTSMRYSPYAFHIIVTNPVNAMCLAAMREGHIPPARITGMAGILDSARFQYFIAHELDVSVENVQALVLGEHGDDMLPLPRFSTVAGRPVSRLLGPERLERVIGRTRDGGAEIISMMGTSAFYAPASAVTQMVAAVVMDKKKILPCAAHLNGQYGLKGVFMGVPVKLGADGVLEVAEFDLTPEELGVLARSAEAVRAGMRAADCLPD